MNFASGNFFLFYLIVATLYWAIRNREARKVLLLAASYYFYMSWNVQLIGLVLLSTAIDYAVGLALGAATKSWQKRVALGVSCVGQLGMLAFFKYGNFFIDSFKTLTDSLGVHFSVSELHILLPIGISFYTFQSLSYTIDVYRGKVATCRNLLDFSVFVAFFPQLVAGPITRAAHFLPQLREDVRWDTNRFGTGLYRIVTGLAKKLVIADTLALAVDPVYAHPESYGAFASWIAAIAFTLQVYADMAAYTDCAIGAGKILGYELTENFNHPFLAQTMKEFWQRWHISLSSWLRDYLYIFALGGNRCPRWRTYLNLIITMFLGGLWHGAGWTYAIWGCYVGVILGVEKWFHDRGYAVYEGAQSLARAWLRILRTFTLHALGLVLFRSQSFSDAFVMYGNMFGLRHSTGAAVIRTSVVWVMAIVVVTHFLAWVKERTQFDWLASPEVRAFVLTGCLLGIFAFAREHADAFIYFQF